MNGGSLGNIEILAGEMRVVRGLAGDLKTLLTTARDALSDLKALHEATRPVNVQNFPAVMPVSWSTAQPVNVQNFPSPLPTSVRNFPATQPVSGTVSVGNFPAPAYPILATQRVFGDITASADIVAAQPGQRIRVGAAILGTSAAVGVTFKSGTAAISPTLRVSTAAAFVAPLNPHGWWETAVGEPLHLAFSATLTLSYHVLWVPV